MPQLSIERPTWARTAVSLPFPELKNSPRILTSLLPRTHPQSHHRTETHDRINVVQRQNFWVGDLDAETHLPKEPMGITIVG